MKRRIFYISFLIFAFFALTNCTSNSSSNESSSDAKDDKIENNSNAENQNGTNSENVDNKVVEKFVSEDGSFKIIFDGKAELTKQPIEVSGVTVQLYSYMYEESANKVFMATYADYPKEAISGGNAKELLTTVKNGFLKNLQITKVDEERDIKIDSYTGIYFKAKNESTFTVMQDYLVDNRLYQIGILANSGYPTQQEIDKFFNSFELVKKK